MEKKLTFNLIISEGFQIALKNILSIIGAVLLWIITIWIPYINIGTTIAIMTIPIELARGNTFSPTFIFDAKYRKNMSDFFILLGLISIGVSAAYILFFIPAIIISIAWSLAIYLFLDQNMKPFDSISKSYELTFGYKWTIFGGKIVLGLIPMIVAMIGAGIRVPVVSPILVFIAMLFLYPLVLSADAVIYKHLVIGETEPQVQQPIQ